MLNFRSKSIGESLEELTTELRRCKESTPHQYPRHINKEHENPTNDKTLNAPILQLIPHE